jgi:hypothetical protein
MRVQHSRARFRWLVIGPFLIVVALLAALGVTSAEILSAERAYAGGGSLWSKGKKDAVYHLANYIESHRASEYQSFVDAIAVPLGDRKARTELERPNTSRRRFMEGGNHADDIGALFWLFRSFRHVRLMADAITIWAEAALQIADLNEPTHWVRQRILEGDTNSPQLHALMERPPLLNVRLARLERRLSVTMGETSRMA